MRRRASVAAVSDVGPRRVNEDRALAVLDDDGSWLIAVADGLGGHPRGDEAAQAAVDGLPRRIADRAEMVAAFAEADQRVLALTGSGRRTRRVPLYTLPMSTLTVAAWTPESGLVVAWMGDTLPFVLRSGGNGFAGHVCGLPHRNPDGTIDACLGMPPGSPGLLHRPVEAEVEIVVEPDPSASPDAVVVCSDGAWEPFVYYYGTDWLAGASGASSGSSDSPDGGIGSACPADPADADSLAASVLRAAKGMGLNDNATVAAAVWR